MAKFDYTAVKRRVRPTKEYVVADPPTGAEIPLTLRKLGAMETTSAVEQAEDLYLKHVKGYGDPEKKGYVAPTFLPPIDGEPVLFSLSAAKVACVVAAAQAMPQEERYDPLEILCLMVNDGLCEGFEAISGELIPQEEDATDPLAPKGSVALSSGTASSETSAATPPSSPSRRTRPTASTSG